MNEVWKDVEGYEGKYEISSKGRLRSWLRTGYGTDRSVTPRFIKPVIACGYYRVGLHNRSSSKMMFVHRLVIVAFVGPRPGDKHFAAHLDGNPLNNNAENLAWCTAKENQAHRVFHGTTCRGTTHGCAKLSATEVLRIRELAAMGIFPSQIARTFNIGVGHTRSIIRKEAWKHI